MAQTISTDLICHPALVTAELRRGENILTESDRLTYTPTGRHRILPGTFSITAMFMCSPGTQIKVSNSWSPNTPAIQVTYRLTQVFDKSGRNVFWRPFRVDRSVDLSRLDVPDTKIYVSSDQYARSTRRFGWSGPRPAGSLTLLLDPDEDEDCFMLSVSGFFSSVAMFHSSRVANSTVTSQLTR